MLLLPSLNEMFDSIEEERFSRRIHPPFIIFAALVVASLATALLAGYSIAGDRGRDWLHRIGMTATIAFAIFVIVELEFPRLGLVRIDATDRAIAELLTTLK